MDERENNIVEDVEITKKELLEEKLEKVKTIADATASYTEMKEALENKEIEGEYARYFINTLEDKIFYDAKFDKINPKVLLEVICPRLIDIEDFQLEKLAIEEIGSHLEEQENYLDKICTYEHKLICLFGVNEKKPEEVQVYEERKNFNLIVRADEENRGTMERIRDLMIDGPNGEKIPLSNVADVISSTGPNTINRENVKRKIVISANASGRDLRGVVNDIQERVDSQIQLPEGYHIEYGGQFESEQSASRILLLASIISIVIIFLLLYMQFRNALESGVILLNLPLALIGGVFTLLFTTGEVSIPAIIGFISLFGIATRNGMLLINRYNMLREEGVPLRESIVHGSLDRLNPILMTALCSALALIPLALRGGLPGNEIQSPMAKVILGGLLTSTFLNAFIIPIVYELMNRKNIIKQDTPTNNPQ